MAAKNVSEMTALELAIVELDKAHKAVKAFPGKSQATAYVKALNSYAAEMAGGLAVTPATETAPLGNGEGA